MRLPAASLAAVVIVAEYWALASRAEDGTNVAWLPSATTAPLTVAPPTRRKVKVGGWSVPGFMDSEKVAETAAFNAIPVSEFSGDVSETSGARMSGAPGG